MMNVADTTTNTINAWELCYVAVPVIAFMIVVIAHNVEKRNARKNEGRPTL